MRTILLLVTLALAACAHHGRDLPLTSSSDPVWPLNISKWETSANALTTVPKP